MLAEGNQGRVARLDQIIVSAFEVISARVVEQSFADLLEVFGELVFGLARIHRLQRFSKFLDGGTGLVRHAGSILEGSGYRGEEHVYHVLILDEHIGVVLANLGDNPTNSLSNLDRGVLEHAEQVGDTGDQDLGELGSLGALGNCAQRDQGSVPGLPVSGEDVSLHELDDRRHNFLLEQKGDLLEAATGTHVDTPLVVFFIFIIDLHVRNASQKKLNEVFLAIKDIVLQVSALLFSVKLLFSKRSPKLDTLRTDLALVLGGGLRSDFGDFLEVVLDVLVLLAADLDEALHGYFSDLAVLALESLEDLLHNEVSFLGDLEVLRGVSNRNKKGLNRELARGVEVIITFDVVGQREHDLVLELSAQIFGVNFFTDVANSL